MPCETGSLSSHQMAPTGSKQEYQFFGSWCGTGFGCDKQPVPQTRPACSLAVYPEPAR